MNLGLLYRYGNLVKLIDTLLLKLYTSTNSELFFRDYILENTPDGLFMIRKDRFVIFFGNDGKICKISKRFYDHDWDMHCRIYDRILKYNDCRIEIPISNQTVLNNNIKLSYTEVLRPGLEFGNVFVDDIANNKLDNKYFLDYIDQAAIVINHLENLSSDYNTGVPIELLVPYKRNKDKFGFFWTDFKEWSASIKEFKRRKIFTLYYILVSLDYDFLDKKRIMYYANLKWKIDYD